MSSRKSSSSPSSLVPFLLTFFGGLLAGCLLTSHANSYEDRGVANGTVLRLGDMPVRKTSHVDDKGRPITKQQLLEPFVVPRFVGYSVATFLPGQTMMPPHEHDSMHEFFYVISGTGIFSINKVEHKVSPGTFLHMAPHEAHGIWVPEDSKEDLKVVVCGVTIGPPKKK